MKIALHLKLKIRREILAPLKIISKKLNQSILCHILKEYCTYIMISKMAPKWNPRQVGCLLTKHRLTICSLEIREFALKLKLGSFKVRISN